MVYYLHYIPYRYEEQNDHTAYENYYYKTLYRFTKSPLYGLQRTKGHSTLPQRSYGLLSGRSRYYLDEETVPGTYRPPTTFYPGADYYMADAMSSHATALSTDTVYDNMDLAARSRGKDKRLMSQVNAALDIDFTPAYNPDRYDRFNLRARQRAARVYTPGGVASKASPKPSGAKAIRSTEGYSKPKNLLSWQYRLDTYVDPTDVFFTPATVYKMRDRVRDAQEKLDLHRQMLDRYLEVDLGPGDDVAARIARKQKDLETRQPVIEEYKCDIKPVKLLRPKEPPFRIYIPKDAGGSGGVGGGSGSQASPLRQRLRKVLCKSRNDPTYFKD